MAVVDAQRLDQLDARPGGLFVVVLRGPCYLGLRTITTCGVRADGIVLLMEPGRSLTRRDVSDVCDVPVIAEIAVTANVARTIDAGLLVARLDRLPEFNALRRHLNSLVSAHDNDAATPNSTLSHMRTSRPKTVFTSVTDLPVPLSGTEPSSSRTRLRHGHIGALSTADVYGRDEECVRRRLLPRPAWRSAAVRIARRRVMDVGGCRSLRSSAG